MADQTMNRFIQETTHPGTNPRTMIAACGEEGKDRWFLCEAEASPGRAYGGASLKANPLVRFCLDHLTPRQQRALEADLELASEIQNTLLPPKHICYGGWEVAYHYEGAGLTSGDYCDLVMGTNQDLYAIIGDVTGKGFAASLLMAHLQATFRALISLEFPLDKIVERASRTFCEITMPAYFATLVCMKADSAGNVEVSNAGHLPPVLVHNGEITEINATGLPLGLFNDEKFSISRISAAAGDTIFLYTDGLSEASNHETLQYGTERLYALLKKHYRLRPRDLISACLRDLESFRARSCGGDDLTIMAIRRSKRGRRSK